MPSLLYALSSLFCSYGYIWEVTPPFPTYMGHLSHGQWEVEGKEDWAGQWKNPNWTWKKAWKPFPITSPLEIDYNFLNVYLCWGLFHSELKNLLADLMNGEAAPSFWSLEKAWRTVIPGWSKGYKSAYSLALSGSPLTCFPCESPSSLDARHLFQSN
jgi:hypothetical protein